MFLRDENNTLVINDSTTAGSPKTLSAVAETTGKWSVAVKIKSGTTAYDVLVDTIGDAPPPPPPPTCGGLVQEAEFADISGSFFVATDRAASGGAYVTTNDRGIKEDFGTDSTISFCVRIAQAGNYVIDARTETGPDSGSSNSFFVTVNGSPADGAIWHVDVNNEDFATGRVDQPGQGDLVTNLAPGDHTFVFHLREDGTSLDQISVSRR